MATLEDAVKAFQSLFENTGWTGMFPAKLGANIAGLGQLVEVPENQRKVPNEVFVRRLDRRGIERPVNTSVEGQYGDTVWVGYPPNSNQLTVFSYFVRPGYGGVSNRGVQKHAIQHVFEGWVFGGAGSNKIGSDPITVQENQFTFLSLRPVSGELSLLLTRGIYFIDGVPYFWNDSDAIDMTSYMPTSGTRLAMIEIDASKTVYVTTNDDWSPYNQVNIEDNIPAITAGRKVIGLVALFAGHEQFTVYDIWNLGMLPYVPAVPTADPITPPTMIITIAGTLTVGGLALRFPNRTGVTRTVTAVHAMVDTAPTGSSLIVDIHKNGTTIFSDQSHRPQIAAAANEDETTDIDVADFAHGDYYQLQVDQIGSTIAGSDLTVSIVFAE